VTEPISFADKPILTGRRVLRPLGPEDADSLPAALADPGMLRLTDTPTTFTREQIVRHCATRAEQDDRSDYAILDRSTGAFLGAIKDLATDNRSGGFRIALTSASTGRGFGSEATRSIVDHVFGVGIHRISLEVYAFNTRARHVQEKVGFVLEGTMRDALRWTGQWVDLMSMRATDR